MIFGAQRGSRITFHVCSFKIVNHDFLHQPLHIFFHKLGVLWMCLVSPFRLFVGESEIQRDLVTLLNHRTLAPHHFAGVKLQHAGNVFEQCIRPGKQFVRGAPVQ
jgi:hypothetical protein